MAMKGLSLDGANKLSEALDVYVKGLGMGGLGWNSGAYYGKDTQLAKLCDDIIHYVYGMGRNGKNMLKQYQDELAQVISTYKSFDNTGAGTLGKIVPKTTAKKS